MCTALLKYPGDAACRVAVLDVVTIRCIGSNALEDDFDARADSPDVIAGEAVTPFES